MIQHDYPNCAPCHADPSGSGPLTPYGRAMGEAVVRTRYPGEGPSSGEEPHAGFLWGAVDLPESVMLGGDVRYLHLRQKLEDAPSTTRTFLMQADLEGAVHLGHFLASASVGYADEGALDASLTRGSENNLVSRHHWVGYGLLDGALLVRAGRMNLPFGIRTVEHTLWVRALTRTSLDDDQQYGASALYQNSDLRAELMLIAGNYQLRPDNYRERGYSAYVEWNPMLSLGLGASSLVTLRNLHPAFQRETWRHAHGAFVRWAVPGAPLVLLGELDYVLESPRYEARRAGPVGYVQADFEAISGMHLLATGEAHAVGVDGPPASYGGWLSYAWFFAPHADLRVDAVYQSIGSPFGRTGALALLLQGHLSL